MTDKEKLERALQDREDALQLCEMLRAGFSHTQAKAARLEAALREILGYHFYGDHSHKYRRLLRELE